MPHYNFALGRPEGECRRYEIGPDEMVIVEGIHGLNPVFTKKLPEGSCVKLYVSVKQQVKSANEMCIRDRGRHGTLGHCHCGGRGRRPDGLSLIHI